MNKEYKIISILLSLIFTNMILSCNSSIPLFGCGSGNVPSSALLSSFYSAPEKVVIEGSEFELNIPGISKLMDGNTVNAFPLIPDIKNSDCISLNINVLSKTDNKRLPLSYKIDSFWLVNGQRAWERDLRLFDPQKSINLSGGPNWYSEGIYGVIKIIDNKGKALYIKSKPISINLIA